MEGGGVLIRAGPMAASVLLHHVVGDLTLGKPDLVELYDTETVEAAARAISTCTEGAVTIWRRPTSTDDSDDAATASARASCSRRFVGMVSSLDVVAFMARMGGDHDRALRCPVSELVAPNPSLLKEVDPATRLIDALDMMKQGVRRLLVRKSNVWTGTSKRFSVLYHGKWLRSLEASSMADTSKSNPSSNSSRDKAKYCCLSREDVARFLIGCLGALAPIPLSSISFLNALTPHYSAIEASSPAIEAVQQDPPDPSAIAVVEVNPDGTYKIIGEISAYKLWKCDHVAAAWAMANLSAGQFIRGAEESSTSPRDVPDFSTSPPFGDIAGGTNLRPRKFSSRSIGFYSNPSNIITIGGLRSMYRGRSAPLTCKTTSSLAAVMAQMLSHRATHVWVTEEGSEDTLVGIVSYLDILQAVTRHPATINVAAPYER